MKRILSIFFSSSIPPSLLHVQTLLIMSILQSSIKVKNPLLEFCLLNGYTMCLGYFTQNRYESVDSFLLNAEHVQNFISIYPNILSTLFFAQLDWFKQSSNDSVDEDKSDTTSQCDDSNEQQLQQPIVQLAPTSVINEETNKLLNRDTDGDYSFNKTKLDSNLHLLEQAISQMNPNSINNDNGKSISNEFNKVSDGDFPFIKNKIFSIAGFDFPVMPFDFQIFNSEMNDAVLGAYTYERLNGLFRDVCQLIWKIIKPAYPNNVPEQCLHEICAVFVYKYPIAQSNFDKIRTLNPTMLKPNLVDIGVRIFCLFEITFISSFFSFQNRNFYL